MENEINDNILSLINKTPDSLMTGVAERVKQRRLEKDWTQNACHKSRNLFGFLQAFRVFGRDISAFIGNARLCIGYDR